MLNCFQVCLRISKDSISHYLHCHQNSLNCHHFLYNCNSYRSSLSVFILPAFFYPILSPPSSQTVWKSDNVTSARFSSSGSLQWLPVVFRIKTKLLYQPHLAWSGPHLFSSLICFSSHPSLLFFTLHSRGQLISAPCLIFAFPSDQMLFFPVTKWSLSFRSQLKLFPQRSILWPLQSG